MRLFAYVLSVVVVLGVVLVSASGCNDEGSGSVDGDAGGVGGTGAGGTGGGGGAQGTVACGNRFCQPGQTCCLGCDGAGTCGPPGSGCPGVACLEKDAGMTVTDAGLSCARDASCVSPDAGSGMYRCGLNHCTTNQVCCGGGNGCSCQPNGVPCAAPLPTCMQANCAAGTCVTSQIDVCETPTDTLGNGCASCGSDGYCASYVRCAAPDTPIATPYGYRAIADLRAGDLVYSVEHDQTVIVPIARTVRMRADHHRVVRVRLATGATLAISPGHPTADGRLFADLVAGSQLDGVQVLEVQEIPYVHTMTYDILPGSATGTYYAADVLVGSTLHQGAAGIE